ncbi:hypothetical protein VTI74DRAFT_5790 [Chaetomium olivicolor]
MRLSRALELLLVGLSAISVAESTFVNINAAVRNGHQIQRRQDQSDSKSAEPATTTSASPPKTTSTPAEPTTSQEPTKAASSTPVQPPLTSSSSSKDAPTPSASSSAKPPATSSAGEAPPSTTEGPAPTSASDHPPQGSTLVMTTLVIVTTTASDGSQVTLTSHSVFTTATPGLAGSSNGGGQSSGMSTQTRNTVIGVVVGVGGAIILGGLALVAWRIWGRKKHQEENDGLMDYPSVGEKPDTVGSTMNGRTPFQSTLESYHAPTQVNQAANF